MGPESLLAIVAIGYAVAQLFLIAPGMGLGYDEAVYASQFSRHGNPAAYHASRGWGTPLLVAPVVMLTDSVEALRIYLTLVSSLLLFLSFRVWLAVRPGYAVPLAAALFAGCWTTVFYGNEVMPNLYTAFGTVALTGLVLRAAAAREPVGRTTLAAVAVVAAVLPLFRPSDAMAVVVSIAGVTAVMMLSRRWRRTAALAMGALAAGSAVGFGQWVLESVLKYGGVVPRLELATYSFGTTKWLVDNHVRALDGPMFCATPAACGPVPPSALGWLAGAALLAAIGLVAAWKRGDWLTAVAPAVVGAGIAGAYLYHPGFTAPRYLLPAYGLWALVVAEGVLRSAAAVRPRTRVASAVACCALVLAAHVYVQHRYLMANLVPTESSRERSTLLAEDLRAIGYGRPCLVYGLNAPQIAHSLGCESIGVSGEKLLRASSYYIEDKVKSGYSVMVVYQGTTDRNASYLSGWPKYSLSSRDWYVRVNNGDRRPEAPGVLSEGGRG
ncbi:hypothetical protein [Planomonospora venezuelensis]|uniref:4-amino-4-deoxy-L-arabinose transferase n=1 Tax=Planomonospora venezuelensis TaxID=1999 RepID=A0A841D746_PLAVE|nr:hypothetical protein [Planomonospora venezuelensis]MBB5963975.1 hypothetical protein [Planomonospora venezuelensis]GIN05416.1 hypothetical protein Pve01_70740 [Planomonospora venezuelensis]